MYVESSTTGVQSVDLPSYVDSLCNVIQALQEPKLNISYEHINFIINCKIFENIEHNHKY